MAKMMLLGLPEDPNLLAAIGKLAIRHGQLDHVLRMTVKTIARLSIKEAEDATDRQGSAALRQRVRKLAKQTLGECGALLRLDALLTRARRATKRRNELLHGLWAVELDGPAKLRRNNGKWRDLPSVAELEALMSDLTAIASDLNAARLDGFLKEALDAK